MKLGGGVVDLVEDDLLVIIPVQLILTSKKLTSLQFVRLHPGRKESQIKEQSLEQNKQA